MTTRRPQPIFRLPDAPEGDVPEQQFRRAVELALTRAAAPDSTPEVLDAAGLLSVAGVLTVNVQCNAYSNSFKVAVSTVSQPTAATTRAASPTVGTSGSVNFAGPYAFGTTIYISVLAYSGTAGDGIESVLFTTNQLNTSASPALEIEITQTASTGAGTDPTTTFTMKVTDPTGTASGTSSVTINWQGIQQLYDNTNATLRADGAVFNATFNTSYSFTATLNKAFRGGGYVKFKATKTGWYRGYATWFSHSADEETTPAAVITIATNTSSSDVTAKASMVVNAPNNAASIYWKASTSSFPSQGSTVSTGTLVTGGAPFTVSDLGVNLSFGDTVYVTVVGVDTFGTITGYYSQVKATRSNLSKSKTIYFSAVQARAFTDAIEAHVTRANDGAIALDSVGDVPVLYLSFTLPQGCTITAFSAEVWQENYTNGPLIFEQVTVFLEYGSTPTVIVTLASSSTSASWVTRTGSCSETTTGRRYTIEIYLFDNLSATANKQRLRELSVTYLPADFQAGL